MLKVVLNQKDAIPTYRSLGGASGFTISLDADSAITLSDIEGVIPGDKIRFVRTGCSGRILYSDSTEVLSVSGTTVTVKRFSDNVIKANIDVLETKIKPNSSVQTFLKFNVFDSEHLYRENDICEEIKEFVSNNYEYYNKTKKRCPDDLVLYNERFLYQATGVDESNRYTFFDTYINNWFTLKLLYDNNLGSGGTGWHREGNYICLDRCIVPVNVDGRNKTNEILWTGSQNIFNKLSGNTTPLYICHEDERFYRRSSGDTLAWQTNVEIFIVKDSIDISTYIPQNFDINLNQKQNIENKLFIKKNDIIDYEKQIFYPVFEENDKLKDIQKITYNLHFRERGETTESGYVLSDEWKIKEDGFWNDTPNGKADLLKYLGFDADDIYYQKKKVGMSFIRLSLYDSKDRRTQSLLGYSTIFIDSATFYKRYVAKRLANTDAENYNPMDDEEEPRIEASFSCTNKYNTDASSEGFYFYLFPSVLENKDPNDGCTYIYMKVEFNNAKYGKTVPFVVPDKDTGQPKVSYESTNKDYIDMSALFEDMYMKIRLDFDESEDSNRYVWRFVDFNSSEIIINLFEPRVNG